MNTTGFKTKRLSLAIKHSLITASILCSSMSVSVFASANTSMVKNVKISSDSLAQAINQFAEKSGILINYDAKLLEGKKTSGLNGSYSVETGFATLLSPHGLQLQKTATGYTIVVSAKTLPPQSALEQSHLEPAESIDHDRIQLPTISMSAVNNTLAGEKINRKSRVGMLGEMDFMDTPFNTVSYTSNHIQNVQAKDLSSLITKTDPTVYNNGSTGGISDNYSIRGFSVSNSDASINGLYGVSPYYRTSPEFAESIEVLKGPSALLNGMPPGGSVGGSVNIVTKRAEATPTRRVSTTYDSESKLGVHLDIGQRFGEEQQFGIRFNGVYRDGDTAVDGQSASTELAALGLDWRFERGQISADLYHSEDHIDGLNRGISMAAGLPIPKAPKPTTVFAPPDTFSNTKDDVIILRGDYQFTDLVGAYLSYGYAKTDFDSLAGSLQEIINTEGDFKSNYSHQRFQYDKNSADAGLKFNFNTFGVKHNLTINATYYHHDQKFGFSRNMLGTDQTKFYVTNMYHPNWDGLTLDKSFSHATLPKTGEVKNTSYGFADHMSLLDDRLNIIVGVRQQNVLQDTIDGASGKRTARYDTDKVTPAFATSYKILENLSVYGNYIEGLSIGATAPVTAANKGEVFPPYQTKQYEIGGKFEMGDFASSLSLFQIKKPNSLTDPTTNIFSFGGEQRNRGVEWGFFGKLLPELNLMGGITYTEAELTKTQGGKNQGNFATATPKLQAKLGMQYDLPMIEGLSLNTNITAMSKQYINAENNLHVAGRTIYDIGGLYKTQIGQVPTVLRAEIKNLSNKAYWASSTSSGLGAPRTLMFSATFDF